MSFFNIEAKDEIRLIVQRELDARGFYPTGGKETVKGFDQFGGVDGVKSAEPVGPVVNPIVHSTGGVVIPDSGFTFSKSSLAELKGVHPQLIEIVNLTLRLTTQDFRVHDGLRTDAEQIQYVKNGTSKTLNSMHKKQPDGYGHAVDLVPIIGGILKWDWEGCYKIACAVDAAATHLGVADKIVWGGAWDRRLSDFGGDPKAYEKEVQLYRSRHAGSDFIDGPHFELRL